MAYIRKRGRAWSAEVSRKGPDGITVRDSATFDTRAEASAWAEKREQEIETGKVAVPLSLTFDDLMRRYASCVSSTKPGELLQRERQGHRKKVEIGLDS